MRLFSPAQPGNGGCFLATSCFGALLQQTNGGLSQPVLRQLCDLKHFELSGAGTQVPFSARTSMNSMNVKKAVLLRQCFSEDVHNLLRFPEGTGIKTPLPALMLLAVSGSQLQTAL